MFSRFVLSVVVRARCFVYNSMKCTGKQKVDKFIMPKQEDFRKGQLSNFPHFELMKRMKMQQANVLTNASRRFLESLSPELDKVSQLQEKYSDLAFRVAEGFFLTPLISARRSCSSFETLDRLFVCSD